MNSGYKVFKIFVKTKQLHIFYGAV